MNYIVFDLEWNQSPRGKAGEVKGLPFEIIEIGAVKLDNNLNELDRFCSFIKPAVYTKINTEVKKLTDITNDMVYEGVEFPEAIKAFLSSANCKSFS